MHRNMDVLEVAKYILEVAKYILESDDNKLKKFGN